METRDLTDDVWETLRGQPSALPGFARAERLTLDGHGEPYVCVAVGSDGGFHLLAALGPQSPSTIAQTRARGLRISVVDDYLVVGRPRGRYLDLRCEDSSMLRVFTALVRDIAKTVLSGEEPVAAASACLRIWRAFWSNRPEVLSENEQLGLFAELLVFQVAAEEVPALAIGSWGGPIGAPHDFVFGRVAFEVKATSLSQHKYQVHGLHQLDALAGTDLYVAAFILSRVEPPLGLSLPDQVQRTVGLCTQAGLDLEAFLDRLARAGYSPEHAEEYQQRRFLVADRGLFRVGGEFPRLTTDSLRAPLSGRISHVQYVVDLSGLDHRTLDRTSFRQALALN